jgi:predicted ribosome quality control (RQC) complex YloA/Tae2 family protein
MLGFVAFAGLAPPSLHHSQANLARARTFCCAASCKPVTVTDYATLAHCVAEVRAKALPARVENVLQHDSTSLELALRTLDGSHRLKLSFSQSHGRMTLRDPSSRRHREPRARLEPKYALAATARSLLQSTALISVSIASPFDRVAKLSFAKSPTHSPCAHIYLELLGNGRSNLALTDGSQSIKACGRQIAQRTAARTMQTGAPYAPPVPPLGIAPDDPSLCDSLVRLAVDHPDRPLSKVLVQSIAGVSPAIARLICEHASVDSDILMHNVLAGDAGDWSDRVGASLQIWYAAHDKLGKGGMRILADRFGYRLVFDDGSDNSQSFSSGSFLEHYFAVNERERVVAARSTKLRKIIDTNVNRARSREELYARKVAQCDHIDSMKLNAEFLFAYAHSWSSGDTVVKGEWDVTGNGDIEVLRVMLPALPESVDGVISPVRYGQQLYRQAGKLERARDISQRRRGDALAEISWLEGMTVSLSMARSVADVADLENELAEHTEAATAVARELFNGNCSNRGGRSRKTKKQNPNQSHKKRSAQLMTKGKNLLTVTSSSPSPLTMAGVLVIESNGLEVIIGRNAKGNERVTFEVARRSDIWLHAAGTPGAHVLVRRAKGGSGGGGEDIDLDDDEVEYASHFAAYFSKASASTNVPVSAMKAGDVRRAPGAPRRLGSVIMPKTTRTIFAKPSLAKAEADAALAALFVDEQ